MERQIHKIHQNGDVGTVHIADEVIAIIAGLAATEVDGVVGMVGNLAGDLVELLGKKNLAKGINVEVMEDTVALDLAIIVAFGCSIVQVTKNVQEKVKSAVETMTGLVVSEVNIKVAGVDVEKK
ncbi:Asp23/Gls24 family envelope stress response protein [Anaerotalea alkaliphila]|uniref:Asp23/Gls24 family envelope stress response protein n=1 Tax=Anaerotalea alkaliphila TaxID=2662126 RepID=A0A7X5KLT8_9FIRM|nr:Asp23/Gls24 family envelope stress response protein [Anaerotalea alkaliphila]NDL66254.1 Asp23/Gls24 family envelope stress response protein [Anaerotalea alkaliphila]